MFSTFGKRQFEQSGQVEFISLEIATTTANNTLMLRTVDEYTYKVIEEKMLKQRYKVHEFSVPQLTIAFFAMKR